jgi:hypothetical protein
MTLSRFHCPVCEAACQVPDVAAASRVRCEQCGLWFVPRAATVSRVAQYEAPVPPPPLVIYTPPGQEMGQGVGQATDAACSGPPPPAIEAGTSLEPREDPEPCIPRLPAAGTAPDSVPSSAAAGAGSLHAPLGPPPPYRPIVLTPRPAPRRDEISPALIATEASSRVTGVLGPPPPYRPVVQTAPAFGRGPAPDLEQWRPTAFTRIQVDRRRPDEATGDSPESDWSLPREIAPEPVHSPAAEEDRFETIEEYQERDRPLTWRPGAPPPYEAPLPGYVLPLAGIRASTVPRGAAVPRVVRRALWGAGIAAAILAPAVALYVGRWTVMRTFPASVRIYATIGLAGTPAARSPTQGPAAVRPEVVSPKVVSPEVVNPTVVNPTVVSPEAMSPDAVNPERGAVSAPPK